MCRTYRCAPAVLDQQDADRVAAHLACLEVEAEVERARRSGGGRLRL